jgi:hypothetical protein
MIFKDALWAEIRGLPSIPTAVQKAHIAQNETTNYSLRALEFK